MTDPSTGPYYNSFCEKSNGGGKKEKNTINSGHLVPWQRMQAARINKYARVQTAGDMYTEYTVLFSSAQVHFARP
jgi:hypothetical protein